ncbi:MAG: hypothetical protein WCI18_06700 [Pseudomonadota bacterium]
MNSKLKNFLLLWSVLGVMMGCEPKGLTTTIKSKTAVGAFENKTDPSTDPSNKQTIAWTTSEDTSSTIPFSISSQLVPSGSCNATYLAYSSSDASLIAAQDAVTWGGIWPKCTAEFSPEPNSSGSTNIEITAHDKSTSYIVKSIKFVVESINDAPTISYISSPQITNEDKALTVAFTADDVDGALTCTSANLLYYSDAPSIVAASGAVSWGGTWPNCTGTINPVANASGSANIIFTMSDGALATSRSFTFMATAVNDAPVISHVANQSTNEDIAINNLTVSISDVDNSLTCATALSAASSNTALLPSAYMIIGGTAPNCTLSLNPVFNKNGTTTVTLTATDGLISSQDTFVLTVNAVNDAPTVSNVASQSTNEDMPLNVSVTINDVESSLVCTTALSATSSNTTVLPNANITIGGTGTTCTVSLNPASFQNGTSTITLTVTDGLLSSQKTFVLTVNAVNNGPSISDVMNQSTSQDTVLNGVPVTITDIDSALTCSNITATSSDPTLIPSASVTFTGTPPLCYASLSPASGQLGNSTIILTVSDGALAASDSFLFTVTKAGWNQEAYLKASNAEINDAFGYSVGLSGGTAIVGARWEDSYQITITNGTTSSADNSTVDAGASYIYRRIGSTWAQQAFLKASNTKASDSYGIAVAISGDTAVVGNMGDSSNQTTITNGTTSNFDISVSSSGASYIYKRTGTTWAQEAYLKASNANASDYFGNSLALSGDTAVIGAYDEDSSQTTITSGQTLSTDNSAGGAGAAYIYRRTGSLWAQEAYLKASNTDSSDYFSSNALAISGDTIIVGAYLEDSNQTTISNGTTSSMNNSAGNSGASYIYKRTGSLWAQEAYIKASNANANDYFGYSAAISGDTAIIGAQGEASSQITITNGTTSSSDNSAGSAGASYVYRRSASTWVQEAYLKASNANANDSFGFSVAISGDTAIIGAQGEASSQITITNGTTSSPDNSATQAGASYIYKRTGSTWAQEAYLKASNSSASDYFGSSVAISGDTVVVGSYGEDSNQVTITNGTTSSADNTVSYSGAVYVYRNLSRMFEAHEIQSAVSSSSFTVSWNGSNLGSGLGIFKVVYSTTTPGANCSSGTVAYTGTLTSVTVSSGLTPGQSYIVRICNFNGISYSEGAITEVTVKGDDLGPNVLSINRGSTSNPVSGTSLIDYIVTFNEPVFGVSPDNFSLNEVVTSTGATGQVNSISCTGAICTVWVNSGKVGQLRLDLTSVTGIGDTWGNSLTAGKTGDQTYTLQGGGWSQVAYIKASNAEASDTFGASLALSGDTAIIAAYNEDSNQTTITNLTTSSTDNTAMSAGASYIYKRTGSTWAQQAYLKASNAEVNDYYGSAVAISGDTAVVGAFGEDSSQTTITNGLTSSTDNTAPNSGASYIYKRTGSTWVQEAYLKATNAGAFDYFGGTVALSGDTVIIGAYYEDSSQTTITNGTTSSTEDTANAAGASYIYRRTSSTWSQEAYLKASNANAYIYFGTSLALSGDTAVVGAYGEASSQTTITNGPTSSTDILASYAGASYIYKRTGSAWAQEAYLKASNADSYDYFGVKVALSGDTAVVGAYRESSNQTTITNGTTSSADNSAYQAGAAYIFRRTGSVWAQEAYLKASNSAAYDNFGGSVGISGDTAVMGANGEDSNQTFITYGTASSANNSASNSGATYIYKRTGSTWVQKAYLKDSNLDAGDYFGSSVSISGDTTVIGVSGEASNQTTITNGSTASTNNSAGSAGAAYVYRNLSRLFDPEVRVSAKSTTSITLSWGSNLGNTTQVKIAPAVLGSTSPLPCTDGGAITLTAGVTSYTYSGLTTATAYGFRVCAFDGTNVSDGAIIRDNTN